MDGQTIAALCIVGATALLFARNLIRRARRPASACSEACNCPTVKRGEIRLRKP